ncbi:MAG: aminotransferase class V-fold PLP-dependent enzyme [Clostridia bacterium]|nr:aminotransferase class V-fold PLP-dependent enzyme [Clostridia bacterium]
MLEKSIEKITDGVYPFHMPGHKRQSEWTQGLYDADITEITGADNLHVPVGIINEAQCYATKLYGTVSTIFMTGGGTAGVLSAISAVCGFGQDVVIARNCHKSVYNACLINHLKAEYVYPAIKHRLGVYGEVLPADVDTAMKKSGAKAVVITSPTYEGIVSDIKSIAKVVHKNGGTLIVDSAHGAHLGFTNYFPKSARELGADIVIESAHKTLPCLTGAALLHICTHRVSFAEIQKALGVFETSSPPYPILCSIDRTLKKIKETDLFTPYVLRLENFYSKASQLKNLYLFQSAEFDKGKLVISTEKTNINGFELKNILSQKYKIELEMAMPNYALAMTSVADSNDGFDRLIGALFEIDKTLAFENKSTFFAPPKCSKVKELWEGGIKEFISAKKAVGRISNEFVYAYPPGSPIIAPGEHFSAEVLEYLSYLSAGGAQILCGTGNYPDNIAVLKEKD